MKRRRVYRWRWGASKRDLSRFNPKEDYATYVHVDRTVYLHPSLRSESHDKLWEALGHELVHALFHHAGHEKRQESLAVLLAERAGHVLHDFHTQRLGLPRCDGSSCHIVSSVGRTKP